MTTKRFGVRLSAEGGRQVRAEFEGVGDSGTRAFQRIERAADGAGAVLRRLAGLAAAAFSTRQIVQYADTWTDLSSRVALAVGSQEAGIAVMGRLSQMARRTYSDLGQTAESWLANSTALRELGMSANESLNFTEALNNALVVSGARGERAAQVNNALSQAMALGVLRGDQLNTIIMNGGRVAELLAEELGVTVNQLRGLGTQGVITGDVIRRALVGNLQLLREEADSMPATIGDAFVLMGNAALTLIGRWDQLLGTSSAVSAMIIAVADNLEILAAGAMGLAIVMTGRWLIALGALRGVMVAVNGTMAVMGILLTGGSLARGLLMARLATMAWTASLIALRTALVLTGFGALVVGAGALVYLFMQLVRGAGGLGEAVSLMGAVFGATFRGIGRVMSASADGWRSIGERFKSIWVGVIAYLAQKWADFLATIAPTWNSVSERINDSLSIDVVGAQAYASFMENAARNAGTMADRFRDRGRASLAGAWDESREAWAALVEAVANGSADAEGNLEGLDAVIAALAGDLDNAGEAGARAGRRTAEGAQEAKRGWEAALESMRKYTEESMDLGAQVGQAIIGAFRSAENAVADFVRTGKVDVRSLVTSIIADFAQLASRRFIFGPLSNLLSGVMGSLIPGAGAALASFDRGGHTGYGARTGGLDGLGGRLALVHPNERIMDDDRPGQSRAFAPAPTNVHFHGVRDMNSFKQGRSQVAADLSRAVMAGRRGM